MGHLLLSTHVHVCGSCYAVVPHLSILHKCSLETGRGPTRSSPYPSLRCGLIGRAGLPGLPYRIMLNPITQAKDAPHPARMSDG